MKILSSAFENNQKIPPKYTCDGEDINPPLEFVDVPENAKNLVLIVDDPDAPNGTWNHWIMYNIDPSVRKVDEKSIPFGGIEGENSGKRAYYEGPCHPSGIHHYHFKLYAIDNTLEFMETPTYEEVEKQIQGHIIDQAELVGLFSR